MKAVPLENWAPTAEDPRRMQYAGPRTAQEVFEELRARLDGMGYLPDEYFDLDMAWENGREIPRDAGLFCTTDYGESEGIYTDVYLKWHDGDKSRTERFAIGKTLGETGADLDRMFLVGAAITKAIHGDGASHARYARLGGAPEPEGAVVHLSGEERRVLLDALMERRNQLVEDTIGVEKVLRRVAGSITEYVNEVGHRPLKISDYDKAVLAIRDGDIDLFCDTYTKLPDRMGDLLLEAAGRPGEIGRRMCYLLLGDARDIPGEVYLAACNKAIDTGDVERAAFFADQAEGCVAEPDPSLYGEMICHAYGERKNIATALIQQCTPEQIAAAKSVTLFLPAMHGDFRTMQALVDKGIDATEYAPQILHTLHASHNGWMAEHLLKQGMKIDNHCVAALHACIKNGGLECGKLLLDRGMSFEQYREWAERFHEGTDGHDDTLQALAGHWAQRQAGQEQDGGQEAGGMTLG